YNGLDGNGDLTILPGAELTLMTVGRNACSGSSTFNTTTSGTYNALGFHIEAFYPGDVTTFTMLDGAVNIAGCFYIGSSGTSTLTTEAGYMTISGALLVGHSVKSTGHAQLNGGTIWTPNMAFGGDGGTGSMDLAGGMVLCPVDVTENEVWLGWIADGLITGYGNVGAVNMYWNGTETEITGIPEPATILLLGIGGFLIRRKRA
ncbi:unnamed protein product, partial [marine sediment metagenome]